MEALCDVIYDVYCGEYVCTDKVEGIWWYFEDHRWHKGDSEYVIARMLDNFMYPDEQSDFVKLCILDRFYREDFESTLDLKSVLVFDNGLYDFMSKTFRAGLQEDFSSLSVGYDYVEFKETDLIIRDIIDMFREHEDHLIEIAGTLEGARGWGDGSVMLWVPDDGHKLELCGIDVLIDLCHGSFGGYLGLLPSNLMESDMGPYLTDKQGTRLLLADVSQHDTAYDRSKLSPIIDSKFGHKLAAIIAKAPVFPGDNVKVMRWKNIKSLEPGDIREMKQAFMWALIHIYYPKWKSRNQNDKHEWGVFKDWMDTPARQVFEDYLG